jgi:TPR repeat protein
MRRPTTLVSLTLGVIIASIAGVEGRARAVPDAGSHPGAATAACAPLDAVSCKARCEAGNDDSCYSLAFLLRDGTNVAKDVPQALSLFERLCQSTSKKEASACGVASFIYGKGNGIPIDVDRKVALGRKGCDLGDATSCFNLATMFEHGEGVPKSPTDRITYLAKACDLNDGESCDRLADANEDGDAGVPVDAVKALRLHRKACDNGFRRSCYNLGDQFSRGVDVPTSPSEALTYFRKGCDLNEPLSCNNVGASYAKGEGVPKDMARALQLFRKSCALQHNDPNINACQSAIAAQQQVAEASLPGLFSQCAANRVVMERWRIVGLRAQRVGDAAGERLASKKFQEITPQWSATLETLREAIGAVTNNEGPRFGQLITQVHDRCSCDPSPTGACR